MPKLKAVPICTEVPKEICNFDPHGSKRVVKKPLVSIYCREVPDDEVKEPSTMIDLIDGGSVDLDGDGIPNNSKSIP